MNMAKFKSVYCSILVLIWSACSTRTTAPENSSAIALNLRFIEGELHEVDGYSSLFRPSAVAQITRLEMFVTFTGDTLARESVVVAPGQTEFSTSLEVPIGEDRCVIVEAWSDENVEAGSVLEYRGVQCGVRVEAIEQQVAIDLYPVPIKGSRIVLVAGSGSGSPGTSRNFVPIILLSADPLRGIQFDVQFESGLIFPDGLVPSPGVALSNVESNIVEFAESIALRVLMFDLSANALPPQPDPFRLLMVDFSVLPEVQSGAISEIRLTNFAAQNAEGKRLQVITNKEPGVFRIAGGR